MLGLIPLKDFLTVIPHVEIFCDKVTACPLGFYKFHFLLTDFAKATMFFS